MLPGTPPAPLLDIRAWSNAPISRRIDHRNDVGFREILLRFTNLDLDPLTRKSAAYENDRDRPGPWPSASPPATIVVGTSSKRSDTALIMLRPAGGQRLPSQACHEC